MNHHNLLKLYITDFRERKGGGRERERGSEWGGHLCEKHQSAAFGMRPY